MKGKDKMKLYKCDMCGKIADIFEIMVEDVSPHDGDREFDKQDICHNCLKNKCDEGKVVILLERVK